MLFYEIIISYFINVMNFFKNRNIFLSIFNYSFQKIESIMKPLTKDKNLNHIHYVIIPFLIHHPYFFELS